MGNDQPTLEILRRHWSFQNFEFFQGWQHLISRHRCGCRTGHWNGGVFKGKLVSGIPDAVKPQWRPFCLGLFGTVGCDLCEVEETLSVCCLPILLLVELSRWSHLIDSLASIPHLKSWTACCQVAGNVTWDQANTAQARKFQQPKIGGVTKNVLVSENGTFDKAIRDGLVCHWCLLHFDFQTLTQSFFKVMVSLVGFARQESSKFEFSHFPINDFSSIWGIGLLAFTCRCVTQVTGYALYLGTVWALAVGNFSAEISERIFWHLSCHIFRSHFLVAKIQWSMWVYWKWCPDMTISTISIEAFQVFQKGKCNWCTHIPSSPAYKLQQNFIN